MTLESTLARAGGADASPERRGTGWAGWVVAVLGYLYYLTPLAVPLTTGRPAPAWLVVVLVVPGLLGLVALGWRRAHPLPVAIVCAALWAVSPGVIGPALVAQEHLARRRGPVAVTFGMAVGMLAAKSLNGVLTGFDPRASSTQVEWTLAAAGVAVATLVGLLRASRAAERRRRAEAEEARREAVAARVQEARLAERERIAREMHDVVAHRISLVALHSGALAYRAGEGEQGEMARMIQGNAQAALTELRAMLTTLRGPDAPPEPPQPTLADLDALVADAEAAGQRVRVERSGDVGGLPPQVSRHAFRIAQEGLTNARKHAPGAPVTLAVSGSDAGVRVTVRNRLADLATPDTTGSGLGLVGVAERVEQVGGRVTHGVDGGEFVLDATLPTTPGGSS